MTSPASRQRAVPAPGSGTRDTRPLVAIDDLRRHFGDVVALDGVSLEIVENEFFALLGPSGCGKTTLLRILAGFEVPDAGSVTLEGRDLLAVPPNKRPLNLMFQSFALFPHMTVDKNVAYGLEREKLPKAEIRRRVGDALDMVGLTALAKRKPHQISGGQKQRVALARAMVKRPRLLLLDEPLGALDKKIRTQMELELKRLQHEAGITFVVVTHDQEEAMSMADRIAVMDQGQVRQVAGPVELYERPASRFVADFIGTANLFEGTVAGPGAVGLSAGRVIDADTADRPPGTRVTVCLRPDRVALSGAAPVGGVALAGTVAEITFYGGLSSCAIEVAGFERPVFASAPGSPRVARGEPVVVTWRADDAVVLDS
jgi:spermidine/putrescine ABC transporter ATP-binding subunit